MMGSGKSTIGRLLAAKLRRPFVDTDQVAARIAGLSVAKIFEKFVQVSSPLTRNSVGT